MGSAYEKLMKNVTVAPPKGLEAKVLLRIARARVLHARIRLALFGCVGAVATASVIPAYSYAASELAGSGFGSYAALLLSDGATLAFYWKEFGLTLLESFPVVGTTLLCATTLLSLSMFRLAAKSFDAAVIRQQFA